MSITISIQHALKKYGQNTIIPDLCAEIKPGEFFTLLGPSGCGKTTLLRMVAGLERPDRGSVTPVTVSCVFQEDRLLPWMTVRENLRLIGTEEQVDQVLRMMELENFANYLPEQLSGGMRRRVAMGRALVYNGEITLMDEPFTGLDPELKHQLIREIGALWKAQDRTVFFITHDRSDAEVLADQICQLSGRPVVLG